MSNRDNSNGTSKGSLLGDELRVKESVQAHLDEQVDKLDYNVVSKLSAARHRALAQQSHPAGAHNHRLSWMAALGGVAVLGIISVVSLQMFQPSSTTPSEQITQISQDVFIEDINLLSAADDIEFYQSVEFLEWMANNSG